MKSPVNLEVSRRMLLRAGTMLGVAYLASGAGCNRQAQYVIDNEPLPDPPFPEPPVIPNGGPSTSGTWYPPASPNPVPSPTPIPGSVTHPPVVSNDFGLPIGVIPRGRWTPQGLKHPSNTRPLNGARSITVHHDGMNAFTDTSESGAIRRLNNVRDAHSERTAKTGEKWADIGYHFIVDPAGRVWEGRPIQYQGAHVQDFNEHNIGVMCMGNFEQQSPTRACTESLDRFVLQLMKQHRIALSNVRTHREWAPTACPGRNLQAYMSRTRGRGGNMALALSAHAPMLLA